MKYFTILFLVSSTLFSQKVIIPVEEKENHLMDNPYLRNYEFRDVNNVFDKFKGKWIYNDNVSEIKIEVIPYYDEVNQQDAIYVNMLFTKSSDTIINTLKFNKPVFSFIKGGTFYSNSNLETTHVFIEDIIGDFKREKIVDGTTKIVQLIYTKDDKLEWMIVKERGFNNNETVKLLPKYIQFTKFEY